MAFVHIRPSGGWKALDLRELWHYRELIAFFTWRDLKVRYKQTLLGAAWAVLQPFLLMVVLTVCFGSMQAGASGDIPYSISTYAALLPWQFFAFGLMHASMSVVNSGPLVTKTYFPRLILPLSVVLSGLVDFGIAFTVMIGMMLYYGVVPTGAVAFLPLFLLMAMVVTLGTSLWFAALNVRFRDVRYIIPFLIQISLFVSPVAYPASRVPESWQSWYSLNPMTGVIEGFRWALLGAREPVWSMLALSGGVSLILLVGGLLYFKKVESRFADLI